MCSKIYLNNLNALQLEAVLYTSGPLLVLAGAGTGKTKVITTKIAYIIKEKLANPQDILAVTFTNKAAKEMVSRLYDIVKCEELNIGTFHSIAAKILRKHSTKLGIGLDTNFHIIDQDDQIRLIRDVMLSLNIDTSTYIPRAILSIISKWKDLGLLPQQLSITECHLPLQRTAIRIYNDYQNLLLKANLVDFNDLLLYNNELFAKNPLLAAHYRDKYKYILIDEYQDTNAVQYSWSRTLVNKLNNICCVGDDDQSIYGWRGAEISNILSFEQDFPNAKVIKLEQNYRSSSYILEAASSIIKNNKYRHNKMLWTNNYRGEQVKIISCVNDKEEANFVVNKIEKLLLQNKYNASNIAILVRAGFQTRAFEEALFSKALPYRVIGNLKFYERVEIKDLIAYIRVSLNENDNIALERIINVPKRSIGAITVNYIKSYAKDHSISMFNAIKNILKLDLYFKNKTKKSIHEFINQIEVWKARYATEPALKVTQSILNDSGYLSYLELENTSEAKNKIENLKEMLSAIGDFKSITEFLEHSSLVSESDTLSPGNAVNLMTLHASKGLEFDLVFLPGWEEGIFPNQRSIDEGEKNLEEERRIAYVGITRAKLDLYITFAESRRMFYDFIYQTPSRFIQEIPNKICFKKAKTFYPLSNRSKFKTY